MPTLGHGKICYLQIPAIDIAESSSFYADVFDWKLRTRGGGEVAFDDGVGEVSGTWVLDTPPSTEAGLMVWIMVEDAQRSAERVPEHGGTLVTPVDPDDNEKMATFRDPAGNLLGIYQLDNS